MPTEPSQVAQGSRRASSRREEVGAELDVNLGRGYMEEQRASSRREMEAGGGGAGRSRRWRPLSGGERWQHRALKEVEAARLPRMALV
jgi:hypothetical protein